MTRAAAATVVALAIISAPSPAPARADPLDVEALICSMPWPCYEAITVAHCEDTDLDPAIVNWAGPYVGPFQIGPMHGLTVEQLQDPVTNVREAYSLWLERGWQPWPYCGFARFGY